MILLVIVTAMLIIGAWHGSKKGLLEAVINIISSILGIMVIVIVAKGVGNFIQGSFLGVVMALILLLSIRIIHKIIELIISSLKLVRALPAGRLIDKVAGAVLGVIETIILIWFLFIIMGSFDIYGLNDWIIEQVDQSKILQYIYASNYLVKLFNLV